MDGDLGEREGHAVLDRVVWMRLLNVVDLANLPVVLPQEVLFLLRVCRKRPVIKERVVVSEVEFCPDFEDHRQLLIVCLHGFIGELNRYFAVGAGRGEGREGERSATLQKFFIVFDRLLR